MGATVDHGIDQESRRTLPEILMEAFVEELRGRASEVNALYDLEDLEGLTPTMVLLEETRMEVHLEAHTTPDIYRNLTQYLIGERGGSLNEMQLTSGSNHPKRYVIELKQYDLRINLEVHERVA